MKWYSSLKISDSFVKAAEEAAADVRQHWKKEPADLGFIFVSWPFRQAIIDHWSSIRREIPVKHLIGCTAGGVIGGGHEVEDKTAVSLTVADLPNVTIRPFEVRQDMLPESDGSPKPWRELVKSTVDEHPQFILLSDPFSIDSDALVSGLDFAFPQSTKIGGLSSGGSGPNENLLIADEKVLSRGAVGVALSGDIAIETVVAQGCRPIGKPFTITESKENILISIDHKPPVQALSELYESLPPRDQELLRTSLFLGIVMDPFITEPKQGDFLIRNIVGLDQEQGLLAIGAFLRNGQTVQFHLRDASTSHDDLQTLLSHSLSQQWKNPFPNTHPTSDSGAVLFSCLGRGQRLYGDADHDTALVKSVVGNIPVGGFFCNGEIGPVGGKTYLHGYTSSIAFFRPKSPR